jgi:hypothetical protein
MLRFLDLAFLGAAGRLMNRTFGKPLPLQEFRKELGRLDVPLSNEVSASNPLRLFTAHFRRQR